MYYAQDYNHIGRKEPLCRVAAGECHRDGICPQFMQFEQAFPYTLYIGTHHAKPDESLTSGSVEWGNFSEYNSNQAFAGLHKILSR
jgi:hypothetical protein